MIGPLFKPLHGLFEEQYESLADAVDSIAERIRILGHQGLPRFPSFKRLKTIQDGHSDASANQFADRFSRRSYDLITRCNKCYCLLKNVMMWVPSLTRRACCESHEKMRWMLSASCELG